MRTSAPPRASSATVVVITVAAGAGTWLLAAQSTRNARHHPGAREREVVRPRCGSGEITIALPKIKSRAIQNAIVTADLQKLEQLLHLTSKLAGAKFLAAASPGGSPTARRAGSRFSIRWPTRPRSARRSAVAGSTGSVAWAAEVGRAPRRGLGPTGPRSSRSRRYVLVLPADIGNPSVSGDFLVLAGAWSPSRSSSTCCSPGVSPGPCAGRSPRPSGSPRVTSTPGSGAQPGDFPELTALANAIDAMAEQPRAPADRRAPIPAVGLPRAAHPAHLDPRLLRGDPRRHRGRSVACGRGDRQRVPPTGAAGRRPSGSGQARRQDVLVPLPDRRRRRGGRGGRRGAAARRRTGPVSSFRSTHPSTRSWPGSTRTASTRSWPIWSRTRRSTRERRIILGHGRRTASEARLVVEDDGPGIRARRDRPDLRAALQRRPARPARPAPRARAWVSRSLRSSRRPWEPRSVPSRRSARAAAPGWSSGCRRALVPAES